MTWGSLPAPKMISTTARTTSQCQIEKVPMKPSPVPERFHNLTAAGPSAKHGRCAAARAVPAR